jgi:DNA-directed RNA polymerase subunit B'
MPAKRKAAKVYINGRLIGFHDQPEKLTQEMVRTRRNNKIDPQVNVAFHDDTNELYINTDAGRVQRPLIVVENGKPLIKEEHLKKLSEGKLTWDKIVKEGLIEYLDPEEEENALIAINEEEISKDHTHLELNPIVILSVVSSMIPYIQHDMAGKALHGAKMFKQSLGISGINYNLRTDTEGYLLY